MRHSDEELPPGLERVLAFVNTLDVEENRDELGSAAALTDWLRSHGLGSDVHATRRDLGLAIGLRDAVRLVWRSHSGGPIDPHQLEDANEVLGRFVLRPEFGADGTPTVAPHASGAAGALGALVAELVLAGQHPAWSRLKLCPAEDCLWAFFDHSKNRSRRWCSMNVCGNRTKTRAYRQRMSANTQRVVPAASRSSVSAR
jgi:predicted RNA-binding Zn ribbon-like protein